MQVDAKPSPWPCAVMLVGLLLFCLTVPRYWEAGDGQRSGANSDRRGNLAFSAKDQLPGHSKFATYAEYGTGGTFAFGRLNSQLPWGVVQDDLSLSLCPQPTIEELIETARFRSQGFGVGALAHGTAGWPVFGPPRGVLSTSYPPANGVGLNEQVVPSSAVTAVIERIGRAMVENSAADLLQPILSYATRLHEEWTAVPEMAVQPKADQPVVLPIDPGPGPLASTLRIAGPYDRLAMRPPRVAAPPAAAVPNIESTQPETIQAESGARWCIPHVLMKQLEQLALHPSSAAWAQNTLGQLRALTQGDRLEAHEIAHLLEGLSTSTQQAQRLARQTSDDALRVELLRAHWAMARRLDCWTVMQEIRVAARPGNRIASRGSLSSLFHGVETNNDEVTNEAALNVELETYEQTRDAALARRLAEQREALEASPDALDQSLADAVDQHYRNANVRVAITSEMLNRLAGGERSEEQPVRDRIAGTPVRGHSHTLSQSSVRLEPAAGRWQLDVEAQGVVESQTLANGGRARLRSVGATDFTAQKTVIVDTNGVSLQPTMVDVTNYNRLVGVTTDFDWVPLFGSYARSRAIQQYRVKRSRARAEVENKVAVQTIERLDRETLDAVDRLEQDVRQRFLEPMASFGVELTPIELTTTEERLVARMRVAGAHQLGGHTPRPQALSDSLASLQLHETALTNATVSLGLDGMRLTAPELQALLQERFPKLADENTPQAGAETVFDFDYRDALQFRFDGGRIEVLLSLMSLEHEGRETRDFIVHAFYVPVVDGLTVELVRDGPLGIEGRLSSGDRARLHNVFGRMFSEDRRLSIVRLENASDPRLQSLTVTQLVLEDGWLGLAIGPGGTQRVAERTRSTR